MQYQIFLVETPFVFKQNSVNNKYATSPLFNPIFSAKLEATTLVHYN